MASSTSTRSSCLIASFSSFTNTANRHDPFSSSFKFTASQQPHFHRRRGHPPQFQRHWVEALDHQSLAFSERFTVASYNILADRNAFHHRDLYLNVPYPFIKWDRRKTVICHELFGWNPDIICLQEVDKYLELSNILVKAGYTGYYKRRTGDSVDGCAMFWKADKFRLLDGESIQFKDIGLRDNVAQLLVFEEILCLHQTIRSKYWRLFVPWNPETRKCKIRT